MNLLFVVVNKQLVLHDLTTLFVQTEAVLDAAGEEDEGKEDSEEEGVEECLTETHIPYLVVERTLHIAHIMLFAEPGLVGLVIHKGFGGEISAVVTFLQLKEFHGGLQHIDTLFWGFCQIVGVCTQTVGGCLVALAVTNLRQGDISYAVGTDGIALHGIRLGGGEIVFHGEGGDVVVEIHALGVGHLRDIRNALVEVMTGAVTLAQASMNLGDEHQGIGNPVVVTRHGRQDEVLAAILHGQLVLVFGHVPVGEALDDLVAHGEVGNAMGFVLGLLHLLEGLCHMTVFIIGHSLVIQTLSQSLLVARSCELVDAVADNRIGGDGAVLQVVQLDRSQKVQWLVLFRQVGEGDAVQTHLCRVELVVVQKTVDLRELFAVGPTAHEEE